MSGPIDVSDYLLGELSPEQMAEAERLVREDPAFRAQVEKLRPVVSRLAELPAEGWESLDAPPLRISAEQLGASPGSVAGAEDRPAPSLFGFLRGGLTLRPATAGLCAAALIAIGVGAGYALDDTGTESAGGGRQVALKPVGSLDSGATGTASFASSTGPASSAGEGSEARIELNGMRPSPPGTYYELWLLNSPTDLVSIGSFRIPESGEATLTVPLPEDPDSYRYFDISVERVGGGPGHSGLSVMRAPA